MLSLIQASQPIAHQFDWPLCIIICMFGAAMAIAILYQPTEYDQITKDE